MSCPWLAEDIPWQVDSVSGCGIGFEVIAEPNRRAIDIREGEAVNEAALIELVRAAVALNLARKK